MSAPPPSNDSASQPPQPASPSQNTVPAPLLATLYEILDAVILVLRGKFGNIELYDPARGILEVVAQRGFQEEFLTAIAAVSIDTTLASARSIRSRKRVI